MRTTGLLVVSLYFLQVRGTFLTIIGILSSATTKRRIEYSYCAFCDYFGHKVTSFLRNRQIFCHFFIKKVKKLTFVCLCMGKKHYLCSCLTYK